MCYPIEWMRTTVANTGGSTQSNTVNNTQNQAERLPDYLKVPVVVCNALCVKPPGYVESIPETDLERNIRLYNKPGTAHYHALRCDHQVSNQLMDFILPVYDELTAKEHRNKLKTQQAASSYFTTELMNGIIENEKSKHIELLEKSAEHRKGLEETSEGSPEYAKLKELLQKFDEAIEAQTALLKGNETAIRSVGKDPSITAKRRLRNKKWQTNGGNWV